MTPWSWYAGHIDETYDIACDEPSRDAVIAAARKELKPGEQFQIVEARASDAKRYEGSEHVPFLRTRNHEILTVEGLCEEECAVLTSLTPDRRLSRYPSAGEPYKIQHANRATALGQLRFSEAVVDGLIAKGMLRVLQSTVAHAGAPARPFTVALSKDGEREHHRLKGQGARP